MLSRVGRLAPALLKPEVISGARRRGQATLPDLEIIYETVYPNLGGLLPKGFCKLLLFPIKSGKGRLGRNIHHRHGVHSMQTLQLL
jgi:hypothetical protein